MRILKQNEPGSEAEISGFSTASIKPPRYDWRTRSLNTLPSDPTEGTMSIFAVNGVRIDPLTGRVTHVRWAQVNPQDNSWIEAPREAHVTDVVDAITGGNDVYTIFSVGGQRVTGPELKTVVYRDASEGIELDVDATKVSRTLDELPQI
nr:phosphatidylserine/phosphatidylglycerophosphate/cardiolipin synthase [Burkholderia stagnalis]